MEAKDAPKSACSWPELNEAQLLDLRQKHDTITRLCHQGPAGEHFCYVRGVRRAEFRAFSAASPSDSKRTVAYENLVKQVVVHPEAATLDAHFERYPALPITFGVMVLELAGGGDGEKKTM